MTGHKFRNLICVSESTLLQFKVEIMSVQGLIQSRNDECSRSKVHIASFSIVDWLICLLRTKTKRGDNFTLLLICCFSCGCCLAEIPLLHRRQYTRECIIRSWPSSQVMKNYGTNPMNPCIVRSFSSKASKEPGKTPDEVWVWTEFCEHIYDFFRLC